MLALAHQVAQMLEQTQRLLGRQAGARFVHQQKLRPADQRERDIDPALHAIGDPAGFLVEIVAKIHHLDHIGEPARRRDARRRAKAARGR